MRWAVLPAWLLALAACAPPGPLSSVATSPPALSPELRDQHNRLDVHYHLSSAGEVSARIVAGNGQQWLLHDRAPRPRGGDYVFQFDGTVPHISPDFDARDDVTHMTYRLTKDARVAPYLDRDLGNGAFQRVWMGEEIKAQAGEQALVWDGLASGQPVATGRYVLGIRARDSAGNVVERSQPLVVEESGLPEASIVSARIGPRRIIRGGQVCLDAIVRNTGATVLRTEGPDPGYIYNSMDTYSSIEDHRFGEHAGYWRVGLNWSGGTDASGATYPYRWGFGKDLPRGEEVTVHGCVNVMNEQDKLVYFAGLVQENIAIHNAGAGLVRIEISS